MNSKEIKGRASEVVDSSEDPRVAVMDAGVAETLDDAPIFDDHEELRHWENVALKITGCGAPYTGRPPRMIARGVPCIETNCLACTEFVAAGHGVHPAALLHDGRGSYYIAGEAV